MYVAGGAARHFHSGERVSVDVDAAFSRRIALPDRLDVAYRDEDGTARLLYFDRQYHDTLRLMHEEAHEDSIPLTLEGIDPGVLDVRLLTPMDLAVSKIGRFSEQDRADIASLARRGLLDASNLQKRALEALVVCVGDTQRLRGNIASAVKIIAADRRKRQSRYSTEAGLKRVTAIVPRSAVGQPCSPYPCPERPKPVSSCFFEPFAICDLEPMRLPPNPPHLMLQMAISSSHLRAHFATSNKRLPPPELLLQLAAAPPRRAAPH